MSSAVANFARNAHRMDPTRTSGLRRAFLAELRRRFRVLKRRLVELVRDEDAFGLAGPDVSAIVGNARTCAKCGLALNAESFFSSCLRDERGHCTTTGGADIEKTKEVAEKKAAVKKEKAQKKVAKVEKEVGGEHGEVEAVPSSMADGAVQDRWVKKTRVQMGAKFDGAAADYPADKYEHLPTVYRGGPMFGEHAYFTNDPKLAATHGPVTAYKLAPGTDVYADPERNEEMISAGYKGAQINGYTSLFKLKSGSGIARTDRLWPIRQPAKNAVYNQRFAFLSNPDKLKAFQEWIKRQLASQLIGRTEDELWRRFVEEGFKKGQGRVWDDFKSRADPDYIGKPEDFYDGSREQFLRSAFANPVAVERVKLLASRTFEDIKTVAEDMTGRLRRVLVDGLVQGQSPREVGKALAEAVDVSEAKAERIARTETIRAHSEGQLQALEDLGVTEVGVQVEWLVTSDSRLCPRCAEMEGVVLKVDEAHGLIPLHPNCRCAFAPAGVGEDERGQKRGRAARRAMDRADAAARTVRGDFFERFLSPADLALRRLLLNAGRS